MSFLNKTVWTKYFSINTLFHKILCVRTQADCLVKKTSLPILKSNAYQVIYLCGKKVFKLYFTQFYQKFQNWLQSRTIDQQFEGIVWYDLPSRCIVTDVDHRIGKRKARYSRTLHNGTAHHVRTRPDQLHKTRVTILFINRFVFVRIQKMDLEFNQFSFFHFNSENLIDESDVSGRHRKTFNGLHSYITSSSWIQKIHPNEYNKENRNVFNLIYMLTWVILQSCFID